MKFASSLVPCAAALIACSASSAGFVGWVGVTEQGYGSQLFVAPAPGVAALAALAGLAGLPRGRRRH